MNLGKINILHVICAVIVSYSQISLHSCPIQPSICRKGLRSNGEPTDLSTSPVNTLNLDRLSILNLLSKGDIWMPSIMQFRLFLSRCRERDLTNGPDGAFSHLEKWGTINELLVDEMGK